MQFPHKEANTPNLTDRYKAELEEWAINRGKELQRQSKYDGELIAMQFLLDTKTRLDIVREGTRGSDYGPRDYYTIHMGRLYSCDQWVILPDYPGSVYDHQKRRHLTAYDVLAYLSDCTEPDKWFSADDVYYEFEDIPPSKCEGIFREYLHVRSILTRLYNADQLKRLREIR